MTKGAKSRLIRIIISVVLLILGIALQHTVKLAPLYIAVYIAAYITAGYDVIFEALRNIKNVQMMDENFLMSIASIGAIALSKFSEAVAVMAFYQLGELFSDIAVNRSRKSLKSLLDLKPDTATLLVGDVEKTVSPEEIHIGDIITIKPGEKIPLDGVILSGASAIDVSAVLGESIPQELAEGDSVTAGSIAKNGSLKVRVTREYADSAVAKIITLGEMAAIKKAKSESFVKRFARVYTPIVVVLAIAVALLPPIILGGWEEWIYRGLMFLVVSCPCALVVSVPLSFFCGMGAASKQSIIIKGGSVLETLSRTNTVCFDKTGTLTDGSFMIRKVECEALPLEEFLNLAAAIEKNSNHPLALCIAAAGNPDGYKIESHSDFAGKGVETVIDGIHYFAGTARWLEALGVTVPENSQGILIAKEKEYLGTVTVGDNLKPDSTQTIALLKKMGIKAITMLTGGSEQEAKEVCRTLKIDSYKARLLPEQKLQAVEELIAKKQNGSLVYVGDGINDVPVLSRADVGFSMGISGSDAAIEAADAVIMNDSPASVATAIILGKKTTKNARFNIAISIAVKLAVMVLSVLGISNMWLAIFADVGVCVICVANAARLLNVNY